MLLKRELALAASAVCKRGTQQRSFIHRSIHPSISQCKFDQKKNKTKQIEEASEQVSKTDRQSFNEWIHEGWFGFRRRTYTSKPADMAPWNFPTTRSTSKICRASSRVGQRTRAPSPSTAPDHRRRHSASRHCMQRKQWHGAGERRAKNKA